MGNFINTNIEGNFWTTIKLKLKLSGDFLFTGLFKLEWEGDGFIGLAAKTYYCYKNDGKDKHSAKGISRKFPLSKEEYFKVLNLDSSAEPQVNKGFVMKGKSTYTYELVKQGLNHFYAKREVLANGLSTTYLKI